MCDDYESLQERFRAVFKQHVERENGIVSAPERLIDNLLEATSKWLRHDEQNWGDCEGIVSEALRDLRMNQLR